MRNPGQSLDEEIQRVIDDQLTGPYIAVVMLWAMAGVEWFGHLRSMPRRPWLFSIVAVIGTIWLVWKALRSRTRVRNLRQGRDGERVVGQFLEGLRENGARIFHDVPGEGFNLDHVVISTRGIYVIETKTISKPSPDAKVVFDGERVTVAGHQPDRNPVTQAAAEADWLRRALAMSTGRDLPVRGVVVYPGWWIEQVNREHRRDVWVLEPKALPGFIEHEPAVISPDDMTLAAFHLSRYVRSANSSI